MNPLDDAILDAYIDDELDPAGRFEVESAMATDPALADRARARLALRDLIAGLPRPVVGMSLAGPIVARLAARRRRQIHLQFGQRTVSIPMRPARWAGVGLAASALLSWSLGNPPVPPDDFRDGAAIAITGAPPIMVAFDPPAGPIDPPTELVAAPPVDPAIEADRERDRRQVRALMERDDVRRILIVADVLGAGAATEQVDEILRKAGRARPDYGRITVAQGVVVDPEHPGAATVFAVVMNDGELAEFRGRLDAQFPGAVSSDAAGPEVITQLAEIGQVAVASGTPAAVLHRPLTPPIAIRPVPPPPAVALIPGHERPLVLGPRRPEVAEIPQIGPAARQDAPTGRTVLVWVATRDQRAW